MFVSFSAGLMQHKHFPGCGGEGEPEGEDLQGADQDSERQVEAGGG